jgi:uncharacterized repeat protein (TIGR02543 family)
MSKRVFLTLVLIAGLPFLAWFVDSQSSALRSMAKANPSSAPSMPSKEAVSAKLATLERGWVKNEGQWNKRALFSAPGYFGTTWVTKDGELLHVAVKKEECKEKTAKAKTCPTKSWVVSERWVDGKVQAIKGEEELGTKVSYLIGNDPSKHHSGLSTYRYVSLGEVWSGVEVKLKATQKTVERLFYVKPGADPSKIQVQLNGAKGLKLSKDGEIIIQTGLGDLKLSKPIAWQEKDRKKLPVEVSYKLIDKNRYSFAVAKADPSLPIVIDPILQSTYLGGNANDEVKALAIHPTTGDIYVAGYTYSTDFPKTNGGAQGSNNNGDGFVSRLKPDLTQIIQSTYLGGGQGDLIYGLAVHPSTGDIYVAGSTNSADFPNTTGGAVGSYGGYGNAYAFVSRLKPDLTQIIQSTYLAGGYNGDAAYALAIHPTTGDVYVAGVTSSINFPNTTGGAQVSIGGGAGDYDTFVTRLNSSLTQIIQSTYLGGRSYDWAYALAIHPSTGDIYVAGWTWSTDFPNTSGGAQAIKANSTSTSTDSYYDGFVSRLKPDLTQIIQSTYLGGSKNDVVNALAIHPTTGDIYVAGGTSSTDFPETNGGAQGSNNNGDGFVSRLKPDLTQIIQSTYLGGSKDDDAYALAIHPSTGDIYVAGQTYSTDLPNTTGGAQAGIGGIRDAFVAKLNSNLTQIIQSTYLGGSNDDTADALAIHPSAGDIYVAGYTYSTDFPNTTGGAQGSFGGGFTDAFVARLSADLAATASSYTLFINPIPTNGKVTSSPAGINCGSGGSSCSADFSGTVTLTAIPSTRFTFRGHTSKYTFAGWGGDCSDCGTSTTCTIIMNANKTCTANFTASGGVGCSKTGSTSSMAGVWSTFVWLSVPAFVFARRIRRR